MLTVDCLVAGIVLPLVAGDLRGLMGDPLGGILRLHIKGVALCHAVKGGLDTGGQGLLGVDIVIENFGSEFKIGFGSFLLMPQM